MIADIDGVNQLISRESISSCFVRDDWDVCTANQQYHYYDIWALRHKIWCPNDCWQQLKFFNHYGLKGNKATFSGIYSKMLVIPHDAPWIEVDSAFGGLAIYHRYVLEKAEYVGILKDGTKICEHVGFHQQIKDQGFKIFINPALINAKLTEYTQYFRTYMVIKRAIKGMFVRIDFSIL